MRCRPDCSLRRTMLSYHTVLSRGAITQWYHSVYSITQCYHAVPSRSAITQCYHSVVSLSSHAVLSRSGITQQSRSAITQWYHFSNHAVLTQCYHAAQSRSAITRCYLSRSILHAAMHSALHCSCTCGTASSSPPPAACSSADIRRSVSLSPSPVVPRYAVRPARPRLVRARLGSTPQAALCLGA